MKVSPQAGPTLEEQTARMEACESHLRKNHQLALAGTLIGATMHEINNRLSALTNYIYLASITLQSPHNAEEYLESATDELRMVGEITSRSLAFVRTDLDAKDIDLIELANSALQLNRETISSKRINVALRMPETAIAKAKRGEILQVLVNLLLNSIDALPHSGSLHVRVSCHRDEAVITVADNGKGIPESIRPALFQSFKSTKDQGNGLGLWVIKQIVDGHHGRIHYRSSTRAHSSGTVFRVALPLGRQVAITNP
jgi:signal transduction histidine kinase